MNNDIKIRAAYPEDMPAVFALIKELAVYENAPQEVTNTVEQLVDDGFGPNKVFDCLVATDNDVVIGFALFYTSYSTWKGKCLYLEDFLVTKLWRNKGVGKLLFDTVYKIAEERKANRLEWQVLDWNEPAIAFYKKNKAYLDETWINCKLIPTHH